MTSIDDRSIIGVDLGGTKVLAGLVTGNIVTQFHQSAVPKNGSELEVIKVITDTIDSVCDESVKGIGIGVPSIVDVEKGIVYDVQNIPSWKKVRIKEILEQKYDIPVFVNNDANCFALGEKYYGKGIGYKNVLGLIVGTGMAAGLIIHDKLYNGRNCGAGEFGMIPYLDHNFEYYSSGQFFENVHEVNGENVFQGALDGNLIALKMFEELGTHLGNAIKTMLYALDPQIIILGGSVSKSFAFFEKSMWQSIRKFSYPTVLEHLKIEVSSNSDVAVLGAAALYYDAQKESG